MTRPLVLIPDLSLPGPELQAASLDGELVPLGEGYLPVDAPLTPLTRAESLAPLLVEPRILLSDRTAAWVWGWLPAMPTLTTSVPIGSRISSARRRRLGTREVVIAEHEVHRWGAVGVTTRVRTLVDLARHDESPDLHTVLLAALRQQPEVYEPVEAYLNRPGRLSHVRRARDRIARALDDSRADDGGDYPLLTR